MRNLKRNGKELDVVMAEYQRGDWKGTKFPFYNITEDNLITKVIPFFGLDTIVETLKRTLTVDAQEAHYRACQTEKTKVADEKGAVTETEVIKGWDEEKNLKSLEDMSVRGETLKSLTGRMESLQTELRKMALDAMSNPSIIPQMAKKAQEINVVASNIEAIKVANREKREAD